MLSNKYLKRYLILLGMTLLPVSAFSTDDCEEFRKQVSIDGGDTWFDANDVGSAPTQVVGGEVEYRFILRNCTIRKVCVDTVINDVELGILDAPVTGESGVGVILPGETVTVTKADAGFENLDQPDRCDTPGTKLNTAIETTRFNYDGSPIETMTDVAYVNCEEGDPMASLGDRVWKDLNGDGIQNCADTNGDGLIGSTLTNPVKDTGTECDAGIDGVLVQLRMDCNDDGSGGSVISARTTSNGGFYFFDNLLPDQNYCVDFGNAPANVDICTTDDGINLGDALFTSQGTGADNDSDADPDSGRSGVVMLADGEVNRNIDAGLVCPVKIGNRVWVDENNDGLQTDGEMNVDGVKVTLLNCDGEPLDPMRMQETVDGMYMFGGEPCGGINDDGTAQPACLSPGEYIVEFDLPEGYSATTPNALPDGSDSDCVPSSPGTARTMCTDLSTGEYNRDRDCGIVPPPEPECELGLEKSCYVVPAPTSTFDKCDGKLQQFTVIWTGGDIDISGPSNDSDGTVSNGQAVTFMGPFDNNDVVVNVSGDPANGVQSTFHMSCSDDDFNDPTDCGKSAGNGKSNDSGLNDGWILEGFIDNSGQVLNCGAADEGIFTPNCSFVTPQAPSCETTGKPDNLTWRYDGGSCDASTFADVQGGDFECTDSGLDTDAFITVMDDKGGATVVGAGDEFTISRDASKEMILSNVGTQELVLHTSCSQPLEVGRTAGALTLVAMDGLTGGVDVTYKYVVTNSGDPATGVLVTDNMLGDIGGPVNVVDRVEFTKMARLFGTTTNVGTVSADQCDPVMSNTVIVEAVTPTCEVSIRLDKVEDKKIKWKISNVSGVDATIDTMSVSWPGSESLKKVKFDGNDILKDVSLSSSTTIGADDWMKQLKDRRLEAGDSGKNLEIEFTGNFPNKKEQSPSDFGLEVTFGEGCSVKYNEVLANDQ